MGELGPPSGTGGEQPQPLEAAMKVAAQGMPQASESRSDRRQRPMRSALVRTAWREGRHPEYGMIPLHVVLYTWAAHDLQHTVQAEEALMQAFIPGTGPFRFRFRFADYVRA